MYLVFAVLALALLLQGLAAQYLESERSADTELLDQAGQQRTLTQQVGLGAAMIGLEAAEAAEAAGLGQRAAEFQALLGRATAGTQRLEQMLAEHMSRSPETREHAGLAAQRWQDANERLWYRSQALLNAVERGDPGRLRQAVIAVQAAAQPALEAAQAITGALRGAAEARAQRQSSATRWGLAAGLVLLGVLGLFVVEPTARAVGRHSRRLREQAAELQRLALVAEHTSALVLITDAEDQVSWVNGAFTRATGWSLDEALARRPDALLAHPQADEAQLLRVRQAVQRRQGLRQECLHRSRDGRDLWLDLDLRALLDAEGAPAGFVRVCTDITARLQQQAKLRTLWAALPVGVTVLGPDGELLESNREAARMLGAGAVPAQPGVEGEAPWEVVRADGSAYPAEELPAMRTLASGQPLHNETLGVRTPGGRVRWLLVNTQPQRDASGQMTGAVACYSDITESRVLQDCLYASARTDALTRLPNRSVVTERLLHAIEHARRHAGYGFAVLFMDFDRFKQVNDTLGHGAGDEMLRQIAQRLLRALRPGDAVARLEQADDEPLAGAMAARLGGDEFVVVLDGVSDVEQVSKIAHRLLGELSEPYTLDHTPVQSSVSIGVVLCADLARRAADGATAEAVAEKVLRDADTAMYEAKRAGRGRWVLFDDSMHQRVMHAMEVEADLRLALKGEELFVVYQPVVELEHRRMVGVEALVRWQHPRRGLVSPADFVPIAEECGLIDALGDFVLRTACRQFIRWKATLGADAPRQLAVNLSRAQLQRNGLVADVLEVLQDVGMAPEELQLEVTESLAAQDERVQATLRGLKKLGVTLSLDDFGTGYSSLACLHQLPVDTVKIDRSFVKHAESVEYHRVLIEATIRVARTMAMTTVAEGIETEGQAALMQALNCNRGQGYLFSRPLAAADLETWARDRARPLLAAA